MEEDPWGSPWTTTDSADPTKPPELVPPPRALLTTTTTSSLGVPIPAFSYNSPWETNDDDFGDWSSAEPAAAVGTPGSLSVWGGWPAGPAGPGEVASGAGGPTLPQSSARPREDSIPSLRSRSRSRDGSIAMTSPIAWPSNAATSPGLKSISRSSSSSVLRLHPLDPWASESNPTLDLPPSPSKLASSPSLPSLAPSADFSRIESGVTGMGVANPVAPQTTGHALDTTSGSGDLTLALRKAEALPSPGWGADDDDGGGDDKGDQPDDQPDDPLVITNGTRDAGAQQGKPGEAHKPPEAERRSRASSSSSDEGEQRGTSQDSPITSTDEDARTRPPLQPAQRKVSGKVQDLVEMYDGIAKSAVAEPPPPTRTPEPRMRSSSREPTGAHQRSTSSLAERRTAADRDNETVEDSREGTPTPARRRSFTSHQRHRTSSAASGLAPAQGPKPRAAAERNTGFTALITKFGPVQFTPDLSSIDALFNTPELDAIQPLEGGDTDIPDGMLHDSFDTVSERRAWYLISRQGTARMHNAGGEEYYRRTTWPSSEVRAETIKIVRRWMEEDSIAGGRAKLGGVARGKGKGNLFGWDSSSPGFSEPVRVDELFAKRRKQRQMHQRVPSVESKRPPSLILPPQHGPTAPEAAPVVSRPVSVGFGGADAGGWEWTDAPPAAAEPTPPEAPNGTAITSQHTQHRIEPQKAKTQLASVVAVTVTRPTTLDEDNEDDDDWGEMVSSPTTALHGGNQQPNSSSGLLFQDWPSSAETPTPSTAGQGHGLLHNMALPMPSTPASAPLPLRDGRVSRPSHPASTAPPISPTPSNPSYPVNNPQSASPTNIMSDSKAAAAPHTAAPQEEPAALISLPDSSSSSPSDAAARNTRGFPLTAPAAIAEQFTDHPAASVASAPHTQEHQREDEDAIVQAIIQGLPDLSYMLR